MILPLYHYFFFSALTLVQRALAAARILAMPAAEMRRLGRPGSAVFVAIAFRQLYSGQFAKSQLRTDEAQLIDRDSRVTSLHIHTDTHCELVAGVENQERSFVTILAYSSEV